MRTHIIIVVNIETSSIMQVVERDMVGGFCILIAWARGEIQTDNCKVFAKDVFNNQEQKVSG